MRATGHPFLQINVLGPAELLTPAREPLRMLRASALAAAWATCRQALGGEADELAELSRRQSPETLAAEILAG